jgi:hypothetical protein
MSTALEQDLSNAALDAERMGRILNLAVEVFHVNEDIARLRASCEHKLTAARVVGRVRNLENAIQTVVNTVEDSKSFTLVEVASVNDALAATKGLDSTQHLSVATELVKLGVVVVHESMHPMTDIGDTLPDTIQDHSTAILMLRDLIAYTSYSEAEKKNAGAFLRLLEDVESMRKTYLNLYALGPAAAEWTSLPDGKVHAEHLMRHIDGLKEGTKTCISHGMFLKKGDNFFLDIAAKGVSHVASMNAVWVQGATTNLYQCVEALKAVAYGGKEGDTWYGELTATDKFDNDHAAFKKLRAVEIKKLKELYENTNQAIRVGDLMAYTNTRKLIAAISLCTSHC